MSVMHPPSSSAWILPCLLLPLALMGCSGSSHDKPDSGAKTVATTVNVAGNLVRSLAGNRINVVEIMGPGVDPHLYKATAGDVALLDKADGVVYVGLHLEGKMTGVLSHLARSKGAGRVVAVGDALPREKLLVDPADPLAIDPHVWFDPELWSHAIEPVVRLLSDLEPDHAEEFATRGRALAAAWKDLTVWARARVETVPAHSRLLVTSHDAFGYMGRAFGLEVVGLQGFSTATEAGLADLARLGDLIKSRRIKAVFVESSVNPDAIRRISKDTGAVVGGELFSDAMGGPGEIREAGGTRHAVDTYEGMIRYNIETIVQALQ
jgi:manganese/zinc/iron transport system substrate-binding protein